ncbi:hypothetical protein THRCLA_02805 [Thraustotheca clavata]|uniref:Uncharacterized protein n=1 Tax=Thraustotheca clavata TaxID=74557 RepID=A0A1W0A438_9STRA|nr:hypothetical protein THRCLA_02805 [Thraustotheca clavata]
MVLPVIIVGGAIGGSCAAYGTYHVGEYAAKAIVGKDPSMSTTGVLAGALTSVATYKAQAQALQKNATYMKWTRFTAPTNVNDWNFKDFVRTSGPFAASRFGLVLVSVAAFGFSQLERGAELKLAQRHRVVVPGNLQGECVWQAELHSPGTTGAASVQFITSGELPKESKLVLVFPDTGWAFEEEPHAVIKAALGQPAPRARAKWTKASCTLEITTLDDDIEAGTNINLILAGVTTPECATPSNELTITTYEKTIYRNTVPPSIRGGHIIDGPTKVTIPSLVPGQINGTRKWMPLNCCPNAIADVALDFIATGAIPKGGKILIELVLGDGWDMNIKPNVTITLRTHTSIQAIRSGSVVLNSLWQKDQQALEIQIVEGVIPMLSTVKLLIHQVTNPNGERSEGVARVTTLVNQGGVIDGPVKVQMARISELREIDFARATAAFEAQENKNGLISVESIITALAALSIQMTDESLRASNLKLTLIEEQASAPVIHGGKKEKDASAATPIVVVHEGTTIVDFLNFFTTIYTPAYKFGEELRTAAARGLLSRLKELVLCGCNPNTKDGAGWTALHCAAEHGVIKAVNVLVEAAPNIEINSRDVAGWTPLMCAAANGHITVISRLLELGADVNCASTEGRTALHWAASRGMEGAVSFLLLGGADKGAVDNSKWTPMHCAAMHGNVGCAKLLLEYGADLNQIDALGRSCWKYWEPQASSLLQSHIEKLESMGLISKKTIVN